MELILIKDTENLGFVDDIVKVRPGYGRNYLIPHGYAVLATESEKKQLKEKLRQRSHREARIVEEAKEIVSKIAGTSIKIKVKVGKEGKLFGSVNSSDVALALANEGISVDKKFIKISGSAIKATGKYVANIRLHREVSAELAFEVISE